MSQTPFASLLTDSFCCQLLPLLPTPATTAACRVRCHSDKLVKQSSAINRLTPDVMRHHVIVDQLEDVKFGICRLGDIVVKAVPWARDTLSMQVR